MPKTTKEVRSRVARSTSLLREPEIEIDLEVDDARLTTPFVRALEISEHRPATEAAGVFGETRRPERRSPTRRRSSTPQFGATPLGVERPMRFGDVVALVGIVLALTGYGVGLLEVWR